MEICLHPEKLGALLDEVSRHRALTEEESLILERIVCRGHRRQSGRITWTPKLDQELLKCHNRPGAIRSFAERNGMTPRAAYVRIDKLRAKKCRSVAGSGILSVKIEIQQHGEGQ